jgi:hypothetical protein
MNEFLALVNNQQLIQIALYLVALVIVLVVLRLILRVAMRVLRVGCGVMLAAGLLLLILRYWR